MKKINLKICGFYIEVYFKSKAVLLDEVELYFKNYLSKDKAVLYNSKIIITELKGPILYKKNKYFFTSLFTNKNNIYYTSSAISIFQFQYIILYIIENLLLDKGFILHASSVCNKRNCSYIFLGRQGIGKSTIANKIKDNYKILSDDSICIRKIDAAYYCYQLPILESEINIKKTNKKFKLRKVFFLRRGKKFLLNKVKSKREIFRVMKNGEKKFFLDINKNNSVKNKFIMEFNEFNYLYSNLDSKIEL